MVGEALDAPDAEPVKAADMMVLPAETWETLTFTPLQSLHRLSLAFDVPQAWQRREEVDAGNLEIDAAVALTAWVIWRPERTIHFRSLEPGEAAMVEAMVPGRPFPEMCEALVPHVGGDEATARAASLLRRWVEEGMIATFAY